MVISEGLCRKPEPFDIKPSVRRKPDSDELSFERAAVRQGQGLQRKTYRERMSSASDKAIHAARYMNATSGDTRVQSTPATTLAKRLPNA